MGSYPNGANNNRQNRLAFEEAKKDYQSLRQQKVDPSQLGPLSQPFRLRQNSIDRSERKANWPELFDAPAFESLVMKLDTRIMANSITDTESAKMFLGELQQLNQALNIAATKGEVGGLEFAVARRFVTGLANEVRASPLSL